MSRTVSMFAGLVAAALLAGAVSAQAKKADPPAEPQPDFVRARAKFSHLVKLPTNDEIETRLEAAAEYLKGGDFLRGVATLQSILDAPDDCFVAVQRPGAAAAGWVSARGEATRMLGMLSPKGREVYEVAQGAEARRLLNEARKGGDWVQVGLVAQRYFHTAAGAEALDLLGTHHLDRGNHATAARWFARLLERADAGRAAPITLLKAALAFRRADDTARADRAWKLLKARARDGLEFGGRTLTLAELDRELQRVAPPAPQGQAEREWLVFRGGAGRNGSGQEVAALQAARWREKIADGDARSRQWIEGALEQQNAQRAGSIPGGAPLLVGNAVVCRTDLGVHAFSRATGEVLWHSSLDGSLAALASNAPSHAHVSQWVQHYRTSAPHILLENSALGQLSSDRRLVFAVEDVAMPPWPGNQAAYIGRGGAGINLSFDEQTTKQIYNTRLVALDVEGGRLVWEAKADDGSLKKSHFLGAPLPVGGKLYGLVESAGALRVVCLNAGTGKLLWSQTLATPKQNILLSGARRIWAAHPAHAEGVLVCSTNAGAVVAVDLAGQGLLWAYAYRDEVPPPEPKMQLGGGLRRIPRPGAFTIDLTQTWKLSAPLIHGGKVVVASPDGKTVDCFDLWSGTPLWKQDRHADDLYLAGIFGDRVVVVGKSGSRALSLKNGAELWQTATGLPTGQGVAAGNRYYLPVSGTDRENGPAVQVLDVAKGAVVGRIESPGGELLGNLVSCDGDVISQTSLAVTVYPQKK